MIANLAQHLGYRTISFVSYYYNTLVFACSVVLNLFTFSNYNKKIARRFVRLMYQISMRSMSSFSFLSIVFGSLLLGVMMVVATHLNLQVQISKIVLSFLIDEFAALFSAFYIAYRFSPMIHKRVLHLSFESHLQTLHNLILPQTLSIMVSTLFLSLLFSLVMFFSAYLFAFFFIGIDMHTYKNIMFGSLELYNVALLLSKSLFFGFLVSIVPLNSALQNSSQKHNASKVFVVLILVELVLVSLQKVFYAL